VRESGTTKISAGGSGSSTHRSGRHPSLADSVAKSSANPMLVDSFFGFGIGAF